MLYAGSPYDQIARQYMADALSGNTTAGYGPGAGINVTRSQVYTVPTRHLRTDHHHLKLFMSPYTSIWSSVTPIAGRSPR